MIGEGKRQLIDCDRANAREIRAHLRLRQSRKIIFGADVFADPAWDILLELYACEIEGRRISVSGVCSCSGVASTTALRWVERLEAAGLISRTPDRADRRRHWIQLTGQGRAGLREALRRTEYAPASVTELRRACLAVRELADQLLAVAESVG